MRERWGRPRLSSRDLSPVRTGVVGPQRVGPPLVLGLGELGGGGLLRGWVCNGQSQVAVSAASTEVPAESLEQREASAWTRGSRAQPHLCHLWK